MATLKNTFQQGQGEVYVWTPNSTERSATVTAMVSDLGTSRADFQTVPTLFTTANGVVHPGDGVTPLESVTCIKLETNRALAIGRYGFRRASGSESKISYRSGLVSKLLWNRPDGTLNTQDGVAAQYTRVIPMIVLVVPVNFSTNPVVSLSTYLDRVNDGAVSFDSVTYAANVLRFDGYFITPIGSGSHRYAGNLVFSALKSGWVDEKRDGAGVVTTIPSYLTANFAGIPGVPA